MLPTPVPAGPVVAITPVVLAPPIPPWGGVSSFGEVRALCDHTRWQPIGRLPLPLRALGERPRLGAVGVGG
jgi:hypothetical protein